MSVVGHTRGGPSRQRLVAERRRRARRRLRRLVVLIGLAVVAVVVILSLPLAQKAIQRLSPLPLPQQYQAMIRQQAVEKHLDPALIAAVIYAETDYDARTSSAGAEGLMQLEPETAEFLARKSGATTFHVSDLGTPAVNIAYGSYYLRYLMNEFDDNSVLALAAYNGGETNVHEWLAALPAGQTFTIQDIPFTQTRDYVTKVLGAQRQYRRKYARQLGYG